MIPRLNRSRTLLYTSVVAALAGPALTAHAQDAQETRDAQDPQVADAARSAPAEIMFDPRFLSNGHGADLDLSRFERGNVILPGTYLMSLFVNAEPRGSIEVLYKDVKGEDQPLPCIDKAMLLRFGLNVAKLERNAAVAGDTGSIALPEEGQALCVDLSELVPDAQWQTSVEDQSIHISLPQAFIDQRDSDYVSPDQWDTGITAGLLGYQLSAYQQAFAGQRNRSAFLGLNVGINLQGWQLRHRSAATWSSREGRRYSRMQTSLERDLPSLTSRLTLGEKYTEGNIFTSIRLRGASLATVDAMLPDYVSRYAPSISGVARTNARVEVFQRGLRIYETSVAPGPFVIDDLYSTISGSTLELVVTEADGSVTRRLIPYAITPMNLRAGHLRYSISAGQALGAQGAGSTPFLQGTLQRGLNDWFTGYGGVSAVRGYQSFVLGTAVNTAIGAFSLDTSGSMLHEGRARRQGGAQRLRYNNAFNDGATSVSVGSTIRSPGYVDLDEATRWRGTRGGDAFSPRADRERKTLEATISRTLGQRYGSLYFNAAKREAYSGRTSTDFSAQYVRSVGRANVTFEVQRAQRTDFWSVDATTVRDTQISLTLNVPLGPPTSTSAMNLSARNLRTSTGTSQDVRVSGYTGQHRQVAYGASLARDERGHYSQSADIGYETRALNMRAGYTRADGRSVSASANGGLIIHPGGIALTSREPETVALAHAEGAQGARVDYATQARIGRNGYGVVSSLRPYRINQVNVDAEGSSDDIDLLNTRMPTAPTRGAVVMLEFKTAKGEMHTMDALREDGRPLPFGAEVTRADGEVVGVVTQGSRIILKGEIDQRPLKVSWGPDETQMCLITFLESNSENLAAAMPCVAAERRDDPADTNAAQQHRPPALKVSSNR